jgi:spermidine/putrescine transport system substrate-binding protein
MAAYPAFCVTNAGQAALRKENFFEAQRTGQIDGASNNPIKLINDGRIHYRDIPVQQSLEDWNDVWSEYKSS